MTVVKSNYAPQENQFYETPTWAVNALIRAVRARMFINYDFMEHVIWEPSAGNHRILDAFKNNPEIQKKQSQIEDWRSTTKWDDGERIPVLKSSDITTYDREHDAIYDFYSDDPIPFEDVAWIVTNPPYGPGNRLAVRYAELALERAPYVALLLTAKFDFGKTRKHLFRDNSRFWMKINLMDRLSFFDGKTGTEDHAWYVWRPGRPNNVSDFPELRYEERLDGE
jgi:hypothetical protein